MNVPDVTMSSSFYGLERTVKALIDKHGPLRPCVIRDILGHPKEDKSVWGAVCRLRNKGVLDKVNTRYFQPATYVILSKE